MIRKLVTAVILVPLAAIIIVFAIANRQIVTVSFDPFDTVQPAYAASLPLFVLIFVLVILGVLVGGAATWLQQARWAWAARRAEKRNQELRLELDRVRHDAAAMPPARLSAPYAGGPSQLRSPAE